jgi:hypothetical protein
MSDTTIYDYIKLYYFLKLLLASMCQCCVWCPSLFVLHRCQMDKGICSWKRRYIYQFLISYLGFYASQFSRCDLYLWTCSCQNMFIFHLLPKLVIVLNKMMNLVYKKNAELMKFSKVERLKQTLSER